MEEGCLTATQNRYIYGYFYINQINIKTKFYSINIHYISTNEWWKQMVYTKTSQRKTQNL